MTNLIWGLIMTTTVFSAEILHPPVWGGEPTVATRNVETTNGFYVVEYSYDAMFATIPATMPPGQPHYAAEITVYQVVKGKRKMVGKPFAGTYVPTGCFEDIPADQVKKATDLESKGGEE